MGKCLLEMTEASIYPEFRASASCVHHAPLGSHGWEESFLTPACADTAFLGPGPVRLEPTSPSMGLTSSLLGLSLGAAEALLFLCASLYICFCVAEEPCQEHPNLLSSHV